MQRAYLLEDCLCSCSIIHTTLETLDFFPPDDPMRQEMSEIIEDARETLGQRLRAVVDGFLQSHEYLSFLDASTLALLEKGPTLNGLRFWVLQIWRQFFHSGLGPLNLKLITMSQEPQAHCKWRLLVKLKN